MKFFVYDLETTGFYWWRHAIHQIAGYIVEDGEVIDEIDIHMRPFDGADIEQEALDRCGVTLEQLQSYQPSEKAFKEFIGRLCEHVNRWDKADKLYLVGFNNNKFDNSFLHRWFEREKCSGFAGYFWGNSLDTMVLATRALIKQRAEMPSFKLHRVAKTLGIEVDDTKTHDALYDAGITLEIFKKVDNELFEGR